MLGFFLVGASTCVVLSNPQGKQPLLFRILFVGVFPIQSIRERNSLVVSNNRAGGIYNLIRLSFGNFRLTGVDPIQVAGPLLERCCFYGVVPSG